MPRKEAEIWNLLNQMMFAIAMCCKVYVEVFTRWLPVLKIASLKPNFVLAEISDFWLKWRPSLFSSAPITCQCLVGTGGFHGWHPHSCLTNMLRFLIFWYLFYVYASLAVHVKQSKRLYFLMTGKERSELGFLARVFGQFYAWIQFLSKLIKDKNSFKHRQGRWGDGGCKQRYGEILEPKMRILSQREQFK